MKRTRLERRTPLRRTAMKRGPGATSYARRERDEPRADWTRLQICAVVGAQPDGAPWFTPDYCDGRIEAHHAGAHGMSHKSDDDTLVPLCKHHHESITGKIGGYGCFDAMGKIGRRVWQDLMIDRYRARYDGHLRALATFLI